MNRSSLSPPSLSLSLSLNCVPSRPRANPFNYCRKKNEEKKREREINKINFSPLKSGFDDDDDYNVDCVVPQCILLCDHCRAVLCVESFHFVNSIKVTDFFCYIFFVEKIQIDC